MKIKTIIYTTSESLWPMTFFDEIMRTVNTVEGAEMELPEIVHAPNITPRTKTVDGKVRIDFDWLKEQFPAHGANVVVFHFSLADRIAWGLDRSINGSYNRNIGDNTMEFWLCANPNQLSTRVQRQTKYQFPRVFLHELAHGIVHWTGYDRNSVHHYDYDLKDIKSLFPHLSFKRWNLLYQLKNLLTLLVELLSAQKLSRITEWAKAIQKFEGYYQPGENPKYPNGSISYRNNNPGNLRWSPFQNGTEGGFSTFRTYEEGFDALEYQLTIAANGKSQVYTPEMTLLRFFQVYAPSSDNNYPDIYAKFVADSLGININTKIKTLL